ncbi:hypothetical protein R3P38DRAFT_3573662 [Favolaschia claudopus]|uniref:Ubiquitin-like protease family profile domain-containing protein n=1 Tax=Favolaschia claudopus TaxID=2862362 RepID=A0AAW0AME3_9AGAR
MARIKRSVRAHQTASSSGFGSHFTSPVKSNDARKKRKVTDLGAAQRHARVSDKLDALLRGETPSRPPAAAPGPIPDASTSPDVQMDPWMDVDPPEQPPSTPSRPPPPSVPPRTRLSITDAAHARLNASWNRLLPQLEVPWSQYYERTHGRQRDPIPSALVYQCTTSCNGSTTVHNIKCLYSTFIQYVSVTTCPCKPVAVLLVEHGVFPASPTRPKTGVSYDLLDFYRALFERSCDAVTALAAALHTVYERRGFKVMTTGSQTEEQSVDPFRRLLIQAVQWSGNLRVRIQRRVEAALMRAELSIQQQEAQRNSTSTAGGGSVSASVPASAGASALNPLPVSTSSASTSTSTSTSASASTPASPPNTSTSVPQPTPQASASASASNRAHRTLIQRCPACFNLTRWGRPLSEGGDCQFGADGCYSYVHVKNAGDGPISYDADRFLPKATVDAVKRRIANARKSPIANPKRSVPQEVIDLCEESWEAANEKKKKSKADRYDASGVFVLTCRHGQPIVLANIDTPGEQQCYIIAMLEEVIRMLPEIATIWQAYDVACITDHSLNLYPIVSPSVRSRVAFVLNGMHAYGHQWACQLVYSPRFRVGMGLSDHEGVERFWSRIRKLIPLTRTQWSSRRIWMLDQYADFVANEGLAGLGSWIHRQQEKNLTSKYRAASKVVDECQVTDTELRTQWAAQKVAQTSIRAHAPARLRRELDKVLSLQTQIDAVEKAIEDTKTTLKGTGASACSLKILHGLEVTHERLSEEAEALYGSLNIHESFPELRSFPLEFAQTLLSLRDLKINIRKRAIGSFMEWETLDRAVSGRREALGTKLHQVTRKAITKRQPALLKAINKFNAGCATLEKLSPPNSSIPIPSPLSTQLNGLRNDPTLHEDVWITPSEGPIPRWLNDEDVRDGIRSLHVLDRCAEEVIRLNLERDNMQRWLTEEKDIIKRGIELVDNSSDSWLSFFLLQRQSELSDLDHRWTPFLRPQDINNRVITSSTASVRASVASARGVTPVTPLRFGLRRTLYCPSCRPTIKPCLPHVSTPPLQRIARVSVLVDEDELLEDVDFPAQGGDGGADPDTGDTSDDEEVEIIEQIFDNSDNEAEVETSVVETSPDILDVQWEFKIPDRIDTNFATHLDARNHTLRSIATPGDFIHYVVRPGRRPLQITMGDLYPFTITTGRLTGFGLNGAARSLLNIFCAPHSPVQASANQCAVLSTYDLGRVHFKGSDPDMWRHISPTEYWNKPLWLIPIHRPRQEHWVLCVVVIPTRELLFFDSLASRGGWRQDLRDVMLLIARLVVLANRNKHPLHVSTEDPDEKWSARPLFKVGEPRQHNDYDCGVWVLSMMAAFMRGNQDIQMANVDVPWVRHVLRKHIETLPIS